VLPGERKERDVGITQRCFQLSFLRPTSKLLRDPGDVVIDPFAGAGSTLVACGLTGGAATRSSWNRSTAISFAPVMPRLSRGTGGLSDDLHPEEGRLRRPGLRERAAVPKRACKTERLLVVVCLRRAPKAVRGIRQLTALSPIERETRRAALDALNRMREEGLSLFRAARKAGTTPGAVVRHAGSALEHTGTRYRALPADRLLRVMTVLGEDGVEHEVVVRGSRVASLVGEHWSGGRSLPKDRRRTLACAGSRGKRIAGFKLETDPTSIDLWERRGELEIEDIYELTR